MKTQWPHGRLNEADGRRDARSPGEQRMKTRYLPAERQESLPAPGEATTTLSVTELRRR
jgi:hypothetical protein